MDRCIFLDFLDKLREHLEKQIALNETEKRKEEEERLLLGRLEQTRLAEELREDREQMTKHKKHLQKAYKSALDYQVTKYYVLL